MAAAPGLTSDMAAIAEHHQEGIRLHRRVASRRGRAEHQRITYVALMVLGVDGMKRLGETFCAHAER